REELGEAALGVLEEQAAVLDVEVLHLDEVGVFEGAEEVVLALEPLEQAVGVVCPGPDLLDGGADARGGVLAAPDQPVRALAEDGELLVVHGPSSLLAAAPAARQVEQAAADERPGLQQRRLGLRGKRRGSHLGKERLQLVADLLIVDERLALAV